MEISLEEKKAEAIKRLKMLNVFPETIRQFERDNKVSRSEPPFGAFYWVEGEDLERLRHFEKEHNALVYMVIRGYYGELGTLDSYLYVSDYRDEWEMDIEDLKENQPLVYVENLDDPFCSEFGHIGIRLTVAAGLARTW